MRRRPGWISSSRPHGLQHGPQRRDLRKTARREVRPPILILLSLLLACFPRHAECWRLRIARRGAAAAGLVGRGLRRVRRGRAAARAEVARAAARAAARRRERRAGGRALVRATHRLRELRGGCSNLGRPRAAADRRGWCGIRGRAVAGPVRGAGARGRGCGCGVRGTAALLPSTVLCGAAGAAQRRRWQRRRRGRCSGCRRARPGCMFRGCSSVANAHENYAMWMSSCEV